MNKKIFLFFLFNMIVFTIYCDYGGESLAYLKLKAGARATAMGGAWTSLSDNLSGILYNPAGIIKLEGLELFAETYLLSFERSINFISTGKPVSIGYNYYSLALSWFNYSAGPVEMRLMNSPEPLKLMSDISHVLYFTLAVKLAKNIDFGVNFKFIYQSTGDKKALGFGFDSGFLIEVIDNLNFGLSIMNISTYLNWKNDNYTETAPVIINEGISYVFKSVMNIKNFDILVACDTIYDIYGYFLIKPGMEMKLNEFFYIRTGFDKTITVGTGFKFKPSEIFIIKFDYALSVDTILQDNLNNRISMVVDYIFPHWENAEL